MSQIAALRQLIAQRYPDATPLPKQGAAVVPTGILPLDEILPGQGFPRGKLTAWQAEGGAGAVLRPACRALVAAGERVAWLGTGGTIALDPMETRGILLLQSASSRQALRSAEVLLRSGGLGLLVLTDTDFDRPANIRLTHAAREGGTALVVITRHPTMASLRLSSRFLPHRLHWVCDPFGEPAIPVTAALEIRVDTLGWMRKVAIALPLVPYEFRLSADAALADRRGPSGSATR